MSDFEDDQFENAGSGASLTYPKQCSALRKNEFVMIKGKACKIVDMSTSKTGKHGHAKVHMVALDIFGEFFNQLTIITTFFEFCLQSFVESSQRILRVSPCLVIVVI